MRTQAGSAGPETSGARIGPHALLADPGETAGALRERIRQDRHKGWELICVVDNRGRLLGTLTAPELLLLDERQLLSRAAHAHRPHVHPGTDQEHMASLALHHGATAMPVVAEDGRLAGVVGSSTLMHILRREHVEDIHRLAGIARESHQARQALQAPPMRRLRHRLPWLLAGLGGSVVATLLVSRFEGMLAARPALAFFVPGLVYLADAIGTQSEAIAVRGLSLSHARFAPLFAGELRTGLLIGLVLALLAFPMIWLVFGDAGLAGTVALALGIASMLASLLGLAMPYLLDRLGTDPAYGSGPMATIVQDVLSLAIYFGCVSLLLA